jgi:hypothetical protein
VQILRIARVSAGAASLLFPAMAYAIVGGEPIAPSSAVGSATIVVSTGLGQCSATVIGPRVVLTGAHCVERSSEARIVSGNASIRLTCTPHPNYPTNVSADFALCMADDDMPTAAVAQVNADPGRLTTGKRVTLVGFGCRDAKGISKLGLLSQGTAVITTVPQQSTNLNDPLYTSTKGATSCFGDGGGGLFDLSAGDQVRPLLVGVQSRSDLSQVLYAATVGTPAFRNWAAVWSNANGQLICGIDNEGAACKTGAAAASTDSRLTMTQLEPANETPRRLITNVVYKAGDIVKDIVGRVCGSQDAAYYEIMTKYHEQTTGFSLDANTQFAVGGQIDIPACPKPSSSQVKSVTAKRGDTLKDIFRREADPSKWKGFGSVAAAPSTDSDSFLSATKALNPALDVLAPLKTGTVVSVPTAPLSPDKLPAVSAGLQQKEPRVDVAKTDAELQSGQKCQGTVSATYPYDMASLLDVLASNPPKNSIERPPITVLVADNGIFLSRHGGFNESVLARTEEERTNPTYQRDITPFQSGLKQSHGTQVASLVLGGPLLARLAALTGVTRIKIRPVKIYNETILSGRDINTGKEVIIRNYIVNPKAFNTVVNDAFRHAEIVNMSLKYYEEIPEIKGAITGKGSTLFVVAAGNDDGSLSITPVYPALYGGEIRDDSSNLIAVAALDDKGGIADLSNYGLPWIEIGAPGCGVPVLTYNRERRSWSIEELHGTSLSAPIVSFAAALIKSETKWSPDSIKLRLLVSADLNPGLTGKIVDGRMLNIPKALSLWHDVLVTDTTIRGTVRLKLNGQIKDEYSTIEFNCNGVPTAVQSRRILKLVPKFQNAAGQTILKMYYKPDDNSARFQNAECDMLSGLSFWVKDLELDDEREFSLDQVKDYVRRAFPSPP